MILSFDTFRNISKNRYLLKIIDISKWMRFTSGVTSETRVVGPQWAISIGHVDIT
jgi:hypothetical protein